jgi:hypothetical protein
MNISRPIRYVALAAATLMSSAPVFANAAQHYPRHHHRPAHYAAAPQPRYSCAPWCPTDYNPCDPTYFKIADGRCVDDW